MDYNLPVIEGVDWEKAYHYMPNKEVLVEVLKEFVFSSEEQIERLMSLKEELKENSGYEAFEMFKIQAHAMKAGLRSIGSDLYDPAYRLEIAGNEFNIDVILAETDEFVKNYRELAAKLDTIVGENERTAYNEEVFFECIDRISRGMDTFDISLLQDAVKDIKNMDIPEKYKASVGALEDAARDLSSEEVAALCGAIRSMRNDV